MISRPDLRGRPVKLETLLDLLHHADVTFRYWDGKRRGVVERDLKVAERHLLISALRRTPSIPRPNGETP